MDCLAFYLTSESESNLLTLRYAHMWLMKCQGLISDKHLLKYGLEHTPRLLLVHQVILKLRGVKPPLLFMNPMSQESAEGAGGTVGLPVSQCWEARLPCRLRPSLRVWWLLQPQFLSAWASPWGDHTWAQLSFLTAWWPSSNVSIPWVRQNQVKAVITFDDLNSEVLQCPLEPHSN